MPRHRKRESEQPLEPPSDEIEAMMNQALAEIERGFAMLERLREKGCITYSNFKLVLQTKLVDPPPKDPGR